MKRVCFLTTDNLDGYVIDDGLAIAPLRELGYQVESIPWKSRCDWAKFDAVIIRTTWDYHHSPAQFLDVLRNINSQTYLENSVELVEWNLEKTYLNDLSAKGIDIVSTIFGEKTIEPPMVRDWKIRLETDKIVIKPTISATAKNTFLINAYDTSLSVFDDSAYMVQPLMTRISTEGEFSLFYFEREFSHAILKTPKTGDFRVQEDFGGSNLAVEPDHALRQFGEQVIETVVPTPLYARVDVVGKDFGGFALMELELIEPALYFRYDEESPRRFAAKVHSRIDEL